MDIVILTIIEKRLCVLLIQIGNGVYQSDWAIPGGLVKLGESVDVAAYRVLQSKANIADLFLEQLYTFGEPNRDARGQAVSVAYFSILNDSKKINLKTESHYTGITWYPISSLPKMAFDHKTIVDFAHKRLKSKMEYTNISNNFLPKEFTLTQLQEVYEVILEKKLDKRNFRKKIDALGILKETGKSLKDVQFRPAKLYKFKQTKLSYF